jgi:hypothetical protein
VTHTDYVAAFESSVRELESFYAQREQLEFKIARVKQFIQASLEMMPEAAREERITRFKHLLHPHGTRGPGLTAAIRRILKRGAVRPFTVAEVRDRLVDAKFDFSAYKSNPLASVAATLKRMHLAGEEDLEMIVADGVMHYRYKPRFDSDNLSPSKRGG